MRTVLLAVACLAILAGTAAARQRNPTAHCNDGTYYYGASRRVACAHHRGVSEWLARPAASRPRHRAASIHRKPAAGQSAATKPRSTRPPNKATARCHDGTWSTEPRRAGACARHGGIARWLGHH